ncbi:MAG TPA: ferrochelatase [Terracidiphilus sp.]|nr:ferrochelatase [Terracidiphilus sp.]
MAKQAVLLLAHGTPETVEQIPEYLRNVVSGRPLPQAVIEEIQHRYSLIGRSPLTEITQEQGRLVEAELAAAGEAVRVYVGMRNWRPYIPDVVRQMRADDVEEAAVICMAPQNSRTSVGLYRRAVEAEAGGLRIDFTPGWAHHPLLIEAFAERLRPALSRLGAEVGHPVPVLFTAHSVPCRTIQAPAASQIQDAQPRLWPGSGADPYAEEAKGTAALVAERVPEIPQWWFAFQSQGASRGPWIGPSVESTLDSIAAAGVKTLVLQPIGFLCDHVEILFDVDILFREYAVKLGLRLERPESLNASSTLARAVADLARQGLARLGDGAGQSGQR